MDHLLSLPWVESMERELGRETVKALFTDVLDDIRKSVRYGETPPDHFDYDTIVAEARAKMESRARTSLRAVVNATGVVVHTNLGRSCLPREAIDAVVDVAQNYSTLEYSLETASRGHRNAHVEWLLCRATGAEAALVVNNNAGAVVLALAALARNREVIVSRGELVEIGGSFRIHEIVEFSNAKMVEVGATNRTNKWDYLRAITDDTAMLLKVHPSNFKIEGFAESTPREELAHIAEEKNLILMEDMGSGLLQKFDNQTLNEEPTVGECIASGVHLVTFSGDKLLGGPQIGCLAGKKELIDKLRTHQLLRALRVDKMTLAAFEVVLRLYLKNSAHSIPTVQMIDAAPDELKRRASKLSHALKKLISDELRAPLSFSVVQTSDAVGGGAFPATPLPGWGVAVRTVGGASVEALAGRLRKSDNPIVSGVRDDSLVLHMRTIKREDEGRIVHAFQSLLKGANG